MEKLVENNDSVMENEKPVENSENQMEVDSKTSFPELNPEGPSVLLFTDNNSSLKLLTQYGSESSSGESEEESEGEEAVESDGSDIDILKQISQNIISPFGQETENYSSVGEYREQKPFVILHDSNSESSSSESESDDDLKRIPDTEILEHIAVKLEEGSDNEIENPDDEENESDKGSSKKKRDPLKVKGELSLEDLPPIEDLRITVPEDECIKIGAISSIVDQLVLVQALPNIAPLDLESVLFLESGKKPLGYVFDVLGQVSQPIYCVRFNSHDDVINKKIEVGQDVFCAPRTEYASFVILNNIMNMRGSDASWKNDIEPPDGQLDFSDDEQERQLKRNKKNKNRNRVINPANPVNQQRFSSPNPSHQPRQQWPGNNSNPRFQQNNYSWHGNFSQAGQFPGSSGFSNHRYPNPNGQQSYWRHQNNNNNNY